MSRIETLAEGVTLYLGDCIEALATLPAASIDSVVCDPPYHLTSEVATVRTAFPGRYAGSKGASVGFMGKSWDGGDVAFRPETWAAVLRVMKPGAHLVAFGGTRTYHRMACAIEDAGFEVRDTLAWVYGSGFPKSHDVAKHIDKSAGIWRGRAGAVTIREQPAKGTEYERSEKGAPATAGARAWAGFGTALKPAFEPIILARKPLAPGMTVAGNVLAYGTGGINVDGCRVETHDQYSENRVTQGGDHFSIGSELKSRGTTFNPNQKGRWPANLVHDGSDEVLKGFPETGNTFRQNRSREWDDSTRSIYGHGIGVQTGERPYDDSGSAARFFYTAKADGDDRLGSKHPTVKPLDLMQWLVRLVTPPGGTVLDCFAGTGTTGEAAFREGFKALLIEREAEYQEDIRRRMSLVLGGPDERKRESLKASGKVQGHDDLPLFR
jgi:DNA modification methylase